MAIQQRTTTITGVFAETAATTIPTPPVAGTSYRDESMTEAQINQGWPFKTIVDSAQFNQAMYEYSTITMMAEKYGFIPWSNLTDYEAGSLCLGTDGNIYQALQSTGPSSTAYDPVNDTEGTYWSVWLENYQLGIGDIKASARNANHGNWFLCNGQAISRTTYSKLFSIIGTNYGAGDGSTTFNLPDYRGKFLRGLGGDSAADIYTTQAEGLPAVPYSRYPQNQTARFDVYSSSGGNHAPNQITFQNAQATSDIYGASEHVTPINMAVNYFMRVK